MPSLQKGWLIDGIKNYQTIPFKAEFDRKPLLQALFSLNATRLDSVKAWRWVDSAVPNRTILSTPPKPAAKLPYKDKQPKLTKLEKAFRHAAIRRRAEDAREKGHHA